ncbi:uncharacterized protein LOC107265148 isoform X2 [Cephus cinctus]|uniref:tRNA (uracil(54)-C(5))-methyltransferase n=1 Tax=Cephus cinctus TaxID=211228 RepID=A0AAJ7FFV2_CEPCN|nr:uncharacterized protein LOC107265148 isoform X2 [Cephus cinctus]
MMDDSEDVMFEDGDFEVLDECVEDDEVLIIEPNASSKTEIGPSVNTKSNDMKPTTTVVVTDILPDDTSFAKEPENNSISMTTNDNDAKDKKDEITDDDIMSHLDEIENIVLENTNFAMENDIAKQDEKHEESSSADKSVDDSRIKKNGDEISQKIPEETKKEEVKPLTDKDNTEAVEKNNSIVDTENDWYNKKIEMKVITVKERLSKLARVLEYSYPCYKKWLERMETFNGIPVCKLEPARRCTLEKPHINRWKFICSRKPVQESTEKEKEDSADVTVNKNVRTVWRLGPSGVWGANIDNASEFPPFVMRAVKIFEDFIQSIDQNTKESASVDETTANDENSAETPKSEEAKGNDEDSVTEAKQQWLWLLVRSNRLDELMLFATGKNISRSTMDDLKQVFETGPGKDCNVKSLYCKSIMRVENTSNTTTTFLVGSEALDETVGGIKIQLAPKTNFWSNAAGAENLGKAVADLLSPTPKTTVVEIGCGIGLIGLMLASKCQKVIGFDTPSEVEEAEMTSELNDIKNASFVMGQPSEVIPTIAKVLTNTKAAAIINTNTNIGRAIEVMTGLRKINSLRRLVMVTTLTKHSVRAILELTRPADQGLGNPFMPIRACVVDTLPVGPHFEVVILMERRVMNKFPQAHAQKNLNGQMSGHLESTQGSVSANTQNHNNPGKKVKMNPNKAGFAQQKQGASVKKQMNRTVAKGVLASKKGKAFIPGNKKTPPMKNVNPKIPQVKGKLKGKRVHSPERPHIPPKKFMKKYDKFNFKPQWQPGNFGGNQKVQENKYIHGKEKTPVMPREGPMKRKRDWIEEGPGPSSVPMSDRRSRELKDQGDLRERLSNNRIEPDLLQKVKEQQFLLDMAKQKLSGPIPSVDVATAKQLQNMLSMVLEETNKLQNQLPRSVWDRIAPPENIEHSPVPNVPPQNDPLLKGRYVQEMGTQDILITTANREFLQSNEMAQREGYKKYNAPGMAMPSGPRQDPVSNFQNPMPERFNPQDYRKPPNYENQWNRQPEKNYWNEFPSLKRDVSPLRRPISPPKHHMPAMNRLSPKRPLLSLPRRPYSPPRRHISPQQSQFKQHASSMRRQLSPLRREISSPCKEISPSSRQMSPPRRGISQSRREISPQGRRIPSPRRGISPNQRPPISPSRRQLSPPRRVADEWDIPTRGAVEQGVWQRSNERVPEKLWRNDRPSPSTSNWDHSSSNDRYRKPTNQDKWNAKESGQEGLWMGGGGGDVWNSKQTMAKQPNKEQWTPGNDNRWQNSAAGSSGDNWNIRGKDSFTKPNTDVFIKPNSRDNPWMDNNKPRWEPSSSKDSWNQADKEDWNDLPEDAKDPWGDDGNVGLKDRWQKFDNLSNTPSWNRDNESGDSWIKSNESWQSNKADIAKKNLGSGNWPTTTNVGSWQPQGYPGFQQQRNFASNTFKDRR